MLALGISIATLICSLVNISRIAKRNKKCYEEAREFNEYLKTEFEKLYVLKKLSEEDRS